VTVERNINIANSLLVEGNIRPANVEVFNPLGL
jgi:hypothetical protein